MGIRECPERTSYYKESNCKDVSQVQRERGGILINESIFLVRFPGRNNGRLSQEE